jgi:hypothetical protein
VDRREEVGNGEDAGVVAASGANHEGIELIPDLPEGFLPEPKPRPAGMRFLRLRIPYGGCGRANAKDYAAFLAFAFAFPS